jgi:flagellar motor protein MotB
MSSIAKTNISLSKKDLTRSRIPPVASRNVVFYHKATLGSSTINLLSLTMPSSQMPNAVQATNAEISGAQLVINKKNLSLVSSSKGPLVQNLDYVVVDSNTISLLSPLYASGAESNEIFVGTINSAPISDLVVASAKTITKTYTLAAGSTILNLGQEYKVGENPNEKVGIIKVYVNGVLAIRGVDYNEVDSGNGYGTTIQFLVAPATIAYSVVVDFGVMAITDNNALGTIQTLAGSIKKIADDLSVVAGTSSTDYYTASPSDIERRTFGDSVLSHESRIGVLENKIIPICAYSASTSSVNTTTQAESDVIYTTKEFDDLGIYNVITGVGTIPQTGKYEIKAQVSFSSSSDQVNRYVRLAIQKNGSIIATNQEWFGALTLENRYGHITKVVSFTKNETFKISISASQQQGVKSLDGSSLTNYFSIVYVGP